MVTGCRAGAAAATAGLGARATSGHFKGEAMRELLVILNFTFAACTAAMATPGAVDANGCHDSAKIGFHCHPQRAQSGGLPGGETHRQREARLKRECKGRPNAGACLGYGG